jgi:hypothetical protein
VQDEAEDAWLKEVSDATVVYAAMLGATVGGQLAGILLNVARGWHQLWVPALLSVVLEALAAARGSASRRGRPLTSRESLRLSVTYSIGLFVVTLFLGFWTLLARPTGSAPVSLPLPVPLLLPVVVLAAAVATALRWALMMAFAPKVRTADGALERAAGEHPASFKGPAP